MTEDQNRNNQHVVRFVNGTITLAGREGLTVFETIASLLLILRESAIKDGPAALKVIEVGCEQIKKDTLGSAVSPAEVTIADTQRAIVQTLNDRGVSFEDGLDVLIGLYMKNVTEAGLEEVALVVLRQAIKVFEASRPLHDGFETVTTTVH